MIELSVQSGVRGQITLIVENKGTEQIRLKDITLLWSVNFFDYSEISHIELSKGNLIPGNFFDLYLIRLLRFRCLFLFLQLGTAMISVRDLQDTPA